MSKPVAWSVLIRDGQRRCFEDIWVTLYRELLWGPEAFEEWLTEGEEIDWEPEELSGVAIVDFDTKELRWGESEILEHPRSFTAYQRLLQTAWPGFEIRFLSQAEMYAEVHGPTSDEEPMIFDRPESVSEAADVDEDEDPEDDEEDDDGDQDDIFLTSWATIIDPKGKVRHRRVNEISSDLFSGNKQAVQNLANLKAAEVPPEKSVKEGMWIDLGKKEIGFWGGAKSLRDFPRLKQGWRKWNVTWAGEGYADQCRVSGLPGVPMSEAEALAKFMPQVLSSKKFDMTNVIGAVGGELKKKAVKATGCLVVVMAVPILLVGFFMEKMKEAGYAIGALVVIVAIAFKVIERKIRNKFSKSPFAEQDEPDNSRPPVAGPLDDEGRREGLNRLLDASGFPPLEEIEPLFEDQLSLDGLL